jgi:hypothetical protein
LALAILRVIGDGELRRALIRNGLNAAHQQTLSRFISTVLKELNTGVPAGSAAVPQE